MILDYHPTSTWSITRAISGLVVAGSLALSSPGIAQESAAPASPPAEIEGDKKSALPPCDCDVWCALIVGLRPGTPRAEVPVPPEHAEIMAQLKRAFPDFSGFEILGHKAEPILKEYDCWVVPTDKLFIKVDSLGGEDPEGKGGVRVHLQIWHETDVLVKSRAILRENPIYFVGPKLGSDQLILALQLMDPEAAQEVEAASKTAPN